MTVDIALAVLNGERYLPELLDSIAAQTHSDWRVWIRDDGSTDRSVDLVRQRAATDARIRVAHTGGPPKGVTRAFGWLLDHVHQDSTHLMFSDQDDVWLPHKIGHTLAAMRNAESAHGSHTPILVHTDLTVVGPRLEPLAPSFWAYSKIPPEPTTLRRIIVRNPATGAATMINRALMDAALPLPDDALFHDWWLALVAAAFGRIVAVPESTILYRQHGGNTVGARDKRRSLFDARAITRALRATPVFRRGVRETATQARAFLARFADRLKESDRVFLDDYARLPDESFFARKANLLRLRVLPEHGVLDRIGVLLRG